MKTDEGPAFEGAELPGSEPLTVQEGRDCWALITEPEWSPIDLSLETSECLAAVKQQIAEAHGIMEVYEATSCSSNAQHLVEACNRVAPFVFHLWQVGLGDLAGMTVVRMLDRARYGKYRTMSILRLHKLIERDGLSQRSLAHLLILLNSAKKRSEGLRDARDQYLAHSDSVRWEEGKRASKTFSWDDVRESFDAVQEYIHAFECLTRARHWRMAKIDPGPHLAAVRRLTTLLDRGAEDASAPQDPAGPR